MLVDSFIDGNDFMKSNTQLSIELMYKTLAKCDKRYDGMFIYAVKTTGIFCRPSCKSKTPNLENIYFFENAVDAKQLGFRPCKRCQPDLYVDIYDPQQEIVEEVFNFLLQHYQEKITLTTLAVKIGVSQYYLSRIFKEKLGVTPHQYLEIIRIHKAQNLLLNTVHNSTEICFQVGYNNFSSFYKQFRKICGCSPSQFRIKNERGV
ncbi:AraC family transcriptional regulator, regulatory protein of adaptative response / methylphosphotriester-DNA alkyltransferase methyltransferase [Gracilibacillus orientalis]|uniref:AraC family transcriptional regulator, regulatory protein of adaptative response / methylphosphotriester-DNA alkyltransferase methyltransferase n=1 Tax=Gracilibacillus orientalis TaxID=334253 RepID=A0A1I4H492_9BACI|nr:Ada metal-binding domain-containing protein [Gracilibacillus orientalis]SFL36201.1 AraC family transcriptional regulator, regulatory protein of adaptative response / methylphosphotriester-DNA alkyltransferase methyltransferase [Gracilibacillus orientalis]